MTRHIITIRSDADRERAAHWARNAREGMRVEFKAAKRTDDQNAKLWAMLGEVAAQVPWHGVKLPADDWKFVFMDALKRELRMVPNLDGNGFVNLGRSSSDLSKSEMSDLIELIHEFGARHGVVFRDSDSNSAQPPSEPDTPATAPHPAPQPPAAVAGNSPNPSDQPAPADGPSGGDGASNASPSSSLPEGWQIAYAGALRRALKRESLQKHAAAFWDQHGGWAKHKDGPDAETAAAIYNTFRDNFGNKDAIETLLRELI